MAKMSKKNLEELRRDDVKENNWELENAECGMRNAESKEAVLKQQYPDELLEIFSLLPDDIPEIEKMKEKIHAAWLRVSPEIRTGNPVWKYSVKDGKHFVFIFRSGQKVRVEL